MGMSRLKFVLLGAVLCTMPIFLFSVEGASTETELVNSEKQERREERQQERQQERREERQQERQQERREARQEARRLQRANELPSGCSKNAKGDRAAENQSSQDEIMENASESGVSEAQIAELNEIADNRDDLVGEVLIEERTTEEVIFESAAAQVLVVVPEGAIRCRMSDELTDTLLGEDGGITYIGGPLDNQGTGD